MSDRTSSFYLLYSKDYGVAVHAIRSLQRKGLKSSFPQFTLREMYGALAHPLTRLSDYGIQFAAVYEDLDETSQKTMISAVKTCHRLLQKCHANMLASVYYAS